MIHPNLIEQAVRDTLDAIGNAYGGQGVRNAVWTLRINLDLATVANQQFGYMSCASGCTNPGWLYDVTWLEMEAGGSRIVDVPLVLESEWRRDSIKYDFDKLLIARAHLRVMVFECRNRTETMTYINELLARIDAFASSRPGDRYLFAVWENDAKAGQFFYYPHTVGSSASPGKP